ncbi:MAG: hypothetical protein J7641_22525 [Cyanobacteria bacterium SID2]|nr:hypothetical protein [Cyanobacteria bacterium SID2]MBP0005193.1 hypothetical protein [Cyanobacteria bacterium SBC]
MLATHTHIDDIKTHGNSSQPTSDTWDRVLSWILGSDELLEIAHQGLPHSKRVRQIERWAS